MRDIQNRMVVDSEWEWDQTNLEGNEIKEKLKGPGYLEIETETFVPEEDAFEYAMEKISQDEDLKQEFKKMLVEWFYSGGEWIKED